MTKVFISGSRSVFRLDPPIRARLDKILDKGFAIVIGDANGADKAVQKYLLEKAYEDAEIFCSEGVCRNNIGGWTVRTVPTTSREGTAEFYSAKDRAMAAEATVGLMIWDGRSVGTLMNVSRLLRLGKKAVVYITSQKKFVEFHKATQWRDFVKQCDLSLRRKLEQRTEQETSSGGVAAATLI